MPLFLLTWPAEHQAFCRTLRLRSLLCFQGFMTPAFNDCFESLSFSLWCVWKKLNEKPAAQSCFDLRLFDLVFKALPSTDHLQLVTLLLLIIILSPSGFLLCPKHCVLFRTNNVTWQRATAPTLFSSGRQHRAESHTCAGGDHVDKWADVSWPVWAHVPTQESNTVPGSNQYLDFSCSEVCVCTGKASRGQAAGHTWTLPPWLLGRSQRTPQLCGASDCSSQHLLVLNKVAF